MKYDSALEELEHLELMAREKAGQIKDLKCQYSWPLEIGGIEVFEYTIDFVYKEQDHRGEWRQVGKECKGFFHDRDRLRFKAFAAHHLALGWVILLQQSVMQRQPSFYPIRLSPKGMIQYLDHNRKWARWLFKKKPRLKKR